MFRNASARIRTRLVNRIGGEVPVRFGTSTVSSLGEVFDRLHGNGAAIGQFSVHGPEGDIRGIIVLEGALVHRLVGLMLGEMGDGGSEESMRALTSLDLKLAKRVCEDVLTAMCDASSLERRPSVVLDSVTPTSRAVPSLPRSATVLESTLDFGPPDAPYGLASVLLPAQARGVLWKSKHQARRRVSSDDGQGILRVLPVSLMVVAELSRLQLPLSRLRTLAVGDTLDIGMVKRVELRVSGRPALVGFAGEEDGVRSVRIESRVTNP
ncbi:MAG: hypothetical protein GWP91_12585 [Rhodobacterales bacterium]|nr:hypothetical protein [Rhodobacterales bacterium]